MPERHDGTTPCRPDEQEDTVSDIENRNGQAQDEQGIAQRARMLLEDAPVGYLSTISLHRPGWPFGSVMPFAADDSGAPLFLISSLALHTKNLDADPRASLLVAQADAAADPLAIARLTILGNAIRVGEDVDALHERYLQRHPRARAWSGFGDFHLYRLEVVDLYYVGGFGVQQWIEPAGFAFAKPVGSSG